MPTNQCDIETSALNADDTYASFGAMTKPAISCTSELEKACVELDELRDRSCDILKDSELFIADVPEGEDKTKLSTALAQLHGAIEEFGGGLMVSLDNQSAALEAKLAILRRAIRDAPENERSLELCNRIDRVEIDVCLFADSLLAMFPRAMAQPPLEGAPERERVRLRMYELGGRCNSIIKDLQQIVKSVPQPSRTKLSATLAEVRRSACYVEDEDFAFLEPRVKVLSKKLTLLRDAVEAVLGGDFSMVDLCSKINELQKDLWIFGDLLSVMFPRGPSMLSEDGKKRELISKAFGRDITYFSEPCGSLNEITKFLREPAQFKEMKTKLETPREVVQLAAPFPAPDNNGGRCTVLYNHPNYLNLRAVRKGIQASDDRHCKEFPRSPRFHKIHIAGHPGVGKSHYLIFDLLCTMIEHVDEVNFKVILLIYERAFAYSLYSGWFRCRSINDAKSVLGCVPRWDTYLFIDCCDVGGPSCRTISVSSMNREYFRNFEKSGAERRFLPPWTLDEVKHGFVQMRKFDVFNYGEGDRRRVTVDGINAEFEVWGGNPRILYHQAPARYTPYLLMKAMCGLNKEIIGDIKSSLGVRSAVGSKYENRLTEEDLPRLLYHYLIDPITFECSFTKKKPVSTIIADYMDMVLNRLTIDEYRNLIRTARDPCWRARYFESLCREALVGGSTVHVADLEGHTNSGTNAERKVRVLKMPDCGGYWAFQAVGGLLKPSYPNPGFIYHRPVNQNFAWVDAIVCPPLLLFKYSVNGQWEAEKDEALLKMLCTLVKKYDLDSGAETQGLFFYVVPDDILLKFQLPPSSTIASFLATPGCRCPKEVPSNPDSKTQKRREGESVASGSRQEDTRCWYCRCLKYFHFYVMGIPGFLQEPEPEYCLSGVCTIDREGAFQACP